MLGINEHGLRVFVDGHFHHIFGCGANTTPADFFRGRHLFRDFRSQRDEKGRSDTTNLQPFYTYISQSLNYSYTAASYALDLHLLACPLPSLSVVPLIGFNPPGSLSPFLMIIFPLATAIFLAN